MPQNEAIANALFQFEEELLQSVVRKSDRVSELLAEDFMEFGSSGRVYTKAEMITALRDEAPDAWEISEFKVHTPLPEVALATFRACRQSTRRVQSLRSSLWIMHSGEWQLLFHQGTPCPESESG